MGLSSSQGRLLLLTSRLSDIQLDETLNGQRQAKLAFESEKAASEYNQKMNNYKLQIKVPDADEALGYKKEDLDYSKMNMLGYLVTDANDQVYLEKDEDGNWIIPKDVDGNPLLALDEATGKATIGSKQYNIADGTDYLSKPDVLQNAILQGVLFIFNTEELTSGISLSNLTASTEMESVLDTSDDAQAQSKFDVETARIARETNQLDMELKQLETQHNVVTKEIDSVKEVIDDNVKKTFKLFSNG